MEVEVSVLQEVFWSMYLNEERGLWGEVSIFSPIFLPYSLLFFSFFLSRILVT